MINRIAPIFVLILLVSVSSFSQNHQGNIVEYFGKEKVEEVREGAVQHVFQEGLILRLPRAGFNSSSTPKKPVMAQFLLQDNLQVSEGDSPVSDDD